MNKNAKISIIMLLVIITIFPLVSSVSHSRNVSLDLSISEEVEKNSLLSRENVNSLTLEEFGSGDSSFLRNQDDGIGYEDDGITGLGLNENTGTGEIENNELEDIIGDSLEKKDNKNLKTGILICSIFIIMVTLISLDLIRRRKKITKKFEVTFLGIAILIIAIIIILSYVLI